jgi:hypothetical protein
MNRVASAFFTTDEMATRVMRPDRQVPPLRTERYPMDAFCIRIHGSVVVPSAPPWRPHSLPRAVCRIDRASL